MGLRLLCVVAHPDDECFAFGGALALAADAGVETFVVCFTDGQAATNCGTAASAAELGRMRRGEFAASCEVLGVQRAEVLTYQDGQLEFASLSELAGLLVERIRSFQPQVVLTFGMDGSLNTHADHTTVSAATTSAFHWAGYARRFPSAGQPYKPQRLYHQTTNFFIPDRPAPSPAPWTLTLDVRDVMERKVKAFREHTSQAPLLDMALPLFEKHGDKEYYALMAAIKPEEAIQTTDMFAGVAEELTRFN